MTYPSDNELVDWATAEAERLKGLKGKEDFYMVSASSALSEVSPAIEFLRRHAPGTEFVTAAAAIVNPTGKQSADQALSQIANLLERWIAFKKAGLATALPFPVQARIEASTDLMEQVQQLLDDPKTTPAAPVMLAGAALEEFLRSRIHARNLTITGKPGINTYAGMLRADGDLSPQDVKDITSWAGQRNEAAHGEFDKLTRQRAQIMVDSINLFMRQKSAP